MSSKSQGVGGAKVPSVLLTLTGIAIVAIQVQKFPFFFYFKSNKFHFCRRTCSSVLKKSQTLTVLLHFTMEWPWPAALSVVWPAFQPCAAQHRNDDPRINFKILFHFLSNFILYFFFLKFGFQHFHGRFFGYRSRWIGHFIGHGIV